MATWVGAKIWKKYREGYRYGEKENDREEGYCSGRSSDDLAMTLDTNKGSVPIGSRGFAEDLCVYSLIYKRAMKRNVITGECNAQR